MNGRRGNHITAFSLEVHAGPQLAISKVHSIGRAEIIVITPSRPNTGGQGKFAAFPENLCQGGHNVRAVEVQHDQVRHTTQNNADARGEGGVLPPPAFNLLAVRLFFLKGLPSPPC
jgi:hypothetical protein